MQRLLHKKDKEVIIYIKFNFVSPTQRENKEKGKQFYNSSLLYINGT